MKVHNLHEAPPTALKQGRTLSMLPAVLSDEIGQDPRSTLGRCAAACAACLHCKGALPSKVCSRGVRGMKAVWMVSVVVKCEVDKVQAHAMHTGSALPWRISKHRLHTGLQVHQATWPLLLRCQQLCAMLMILTIISQSANIPSSQWQSAKGLLHAHKVVMQSLKAGYC